MKNSKYVLLFIGLFTIGIVSAQDSLIFHDSFYKKQQQSLLLLSSWSAANLVISPILSKNLYSSSTRNDYFHEMNFNWNLLNAGIVGLGHFLVRKDSKKPWDINGLLAKKKKTQTSLLINMGLDVAYIISGLLIKNSKSNVSQNQGFGNSIMLQGGYLLLYDAIFLKKLKKIPVKKFD